MAKYAGKDGLVTVAGATVSGVNEWSIDYATGTEEVTDFESGGHDEFISTTDGWKGSFKGFKTGAPLAIGTSVALVLKETATSTQKWSGSAIITSVAAETSAKGVSKYSYNFQGTGALTVPTT